MYTFSTVYGGSRYFPVCCLPIEKPKSLVLHYRWAFCFAASDRKTIYPSKFPKKIKIWNEKTTQTRVWRKLSYAHTNAYTYVYSSDDVRTVHCSIHLSNRTKQIWKTNRQIVHTWTHMKYICVMCTLHILFILFFLTLTHFRSTAKCTTSVCVCMCLSQEITLFFLSGILLAAVTHPMSIVSDLYHHPLHTTQVECVLM